jgi:hypothetical protein
MRKPLSRAYCGLALLAFGASEGRAEPAEPFQIRNLNPVIAIFGLPTWNTIRAGTEVGARFEVANHYRLSQRGDDLLVLDGETLRTTFSFSRELNERWTVGLELPYYRVSGGVLDDVIDGWHSAFGMPDGGRNNRPEGDLLFMLGNDDGTFFELDDAQNALGDVQLRAARAFGANRGFVVQATLKAPTGDEDLLTGSGSTDFALTLLRAREVRALDRPAGLYWGLGLLGVGEPERIEFEAEDVVYTAIAGASWQIKPRFGVKAQLDFHSPFFNTQLEELGESAIQATIGAWLTPNERARFEFAIVEDLEVSTAPDVVFHLAAHWRW